jgi:hypothetical protein
MIMEFKAPSNKTILHTGTLHNDVQHPKKSPIHRILRAAAAAQAVQLFTVNEQFLANNSVLSASHYYSVTLALEHLLTQEFLTQYVLAPNSSFLALTANSPADRCNVIQIINQKLLLRVDSDSYTQLGLVGKPVTRNKLQAADYYIVSVPLNTLKFPSKQYKRLIWVISRFSPLNFLIKLVNNQTGESLAINFPSSATVKTLQTSYSAHNFTNLQLPALSEAKEISAQLNIENWAGELLDWIGAVNLPLNEKILANLELGGLNFAEFPLRAVNFAVNHEWRGLFEGVELEKLLESAVEMAGNSRDNGNFVVMSVYGAEDNIFSFYEAEHSRSSQGNGENHAIFVIFPNKQYLLYQLVCETDQSS